ncbi:MAG: hypothetical protein C0518_08245 [Opitutus sp.]|nr:hypothetical protein [Opitutus sp.]
MSLLPSLLRAASFTSLLIAALPALSAGILEDRAIEDSIQNSFVFRELIADRSMVQVYVRRGSVELRGQVADERERSLVEDAISAIVGVGEVENRLFVDSAHRRSSDRWLVARVRSQLLTNRELNGSRLQFAVRAGELVLSGTVRDDAQRDFALTHARPLATNLQVRDEMTISATPHPEIAIDDPSVVAMVRSALGGLSTLKLGPAGLASQDGNVVLRGSAASPDEIAEAVRRAQAVRGVRSVANQLSPAR